MAGAVPDGPEQVGGAQGSRGQTGGGTRVPGQLGSHPGHRGKHQPGQTETGGGGQRRGDRRLQRGKAGGDKHAEAKVGQRGHRQRGGQGGVAADHPGANQLQPATFLFKAAPCQSRGDLGCGAVSGGLAGLPRPPPDTGS